MWIAWMLLASGCLADGDVRQRGAALEQQGHWEQAEALYRVELNRTDVAPQDRFWLLTSLGEIAFDRGEYGESRRWLYQAEDVARALGPEDPSHVRLLTARGTLHLVDGNLTAASADLIQAVAIGRAPLDL